MALREIVDRGMCGAAWFGAAAAWIWRYAAAQWRCRALLWIAYGLGGLAHAGNLHFTTAERWLPDGLVMEARVELPDFQLARDLTQADGRQYRVQFDRSDLESALGWRAGTSGAAHPPPLSHWSARPQASRPH